MAKVLLVEDDNNLREIYEARLQAEGYDIASARDGEEALVVAKAEQPDLVISDVMMPKISGFEMLDILRNTEGLRDVKVIMLTALGQSEDQARADSLGADRYLVKSQVTLEDIVSAAQQLLGGAPEPAAAPEATPAPEPVAPEAPAAPVTVAPAPQPDTPVIPVASAPSESPEPAASISMPPAPETAVPAAPSEEVTPESAPQPDTPQTQAQETAAVEQQIEDFVRQQSGNPAPATQPSEAPAAVQPETTQPETTTEQEQVLNEAVANLSGNDQTTAAPEPTPEATGHKRVIEPITTPENGPKKSLQELLAEEEAKEANANKPTTSQQPPAQTGKSDFDPNSIAL